jgi:hypothetical protein
MICFGVFSLARIVIERFMERGSGHGTFWIISFVVSVLLAAIFQWLNKSEELKRVTHASSYRGAYLSVGTLYTEVMDAIDDKDTKRFISTEIQYLHDPIKQYIFLKGISSKLEDG